MRGGATTAVRPITISNANQYVNRPQEAAVVLNTPFSLIRTLNKTPFTVPEYMTQEEMDQLYSPIHNANSKETKETKTDVVVFIIESFGREYIGAYNELLEDGNYKDILRSLTHYTSTAYRLTTHLLTEEKVSMECHQY